MLIPTISFVVFFLLVSALWPLCPDSRRARSLFIAAVSVVFYGVASPPLLGYLVAWCVLLWWAGQNQRVIVAAVGAGVLQLVFWKTFELFPRGELMAPLSSWMVPLGVSFFTFQGLTYLFGRRKGTLDEAWSLAEVTAFVAFFPTVFSGPILRAEDWRRQVEADPRRNCTGQTFSRAMGWVCLGLFYKLVLSTLLGETVDAAWSEPAEQNPWSLWLAFYGYAFQLYTDFCGYSYLAMAVALLLGFEVPANFDRPYLSLSVQEFWRRWHMSLSSWLRDYLYIGALKGNSKGRVRQVVNVVVTFLVCGAWHGLALHYLIWGAWQSLGVAYSTVAKMLRGAAPPVAEGRSLKALRWFVAFHFVVVGWVWFRAPDTDTALAFLRQLVAAGGTWQAEHGLALLVLGAAAAVHLDERRLAGFGDWLALNLRSTAGQLLVWSAVIVVVLAMSPAGLPPFIYFKY